MKTNIVEMKARGIAFPGNKDPSAYFLTVEAHGLVKIDDETNDHTVNVMMHGMLENHIQGKARKQVSTGRKPLA